MSIDVENMHKLQQDAEKADEPEEGQSQKLGWPTLVQLSQLMMPIVLGALMPWGSWVTYKTISIDEWKNQGPRFTPRDAEALELRIKTSTIEYMESRMSRFDARFDKLTSLIDEVKNKLVEHEVATTRQSKETGGK